MEKVMNEKIIMNYEVVELLHKSSSWGNIVFKVKPQNKEKLYVLKCFPKIENGLQKLIFKREIEALRTLNVCEGIVKLRDSSTELYPFKENECYGGILMDYVPGETLDHINWNKYTQRIKQGHDVAEYKKHEHGYFICWKFDDIYEIYGLPSEQIAIDRDTTCIVVDYYLRNLNSSV